LWSVAKKKLKLRHLPCTIFVRNWVLRRTNHAKDHGKLRDYVSRGRDHGKMEYPQIRGRGAKRYQGDREVHKNLNWSHELKTGTVIVQITAGGPGRSIINLRVVSDRDNETTRKWGRYSAYTNLLQSNSRTKGNGKYLKTLAKKKITLLRLSKSTGRNERAD